MFEAQVAVIRETYGIEPGEVDLPLLPVFALFNPALGMTSIIPEMDPRRPAAADPAKIVQAIQQEGVTNSFGSPTLWRKVADYCREQEGQASQPEAGPVRGGAGPRRPLGRLALVPVRRPAPQPLWRDRGPAREHGVR